MLVARGVPAALPGAQPTGEGADIEDFGEQGFVQPGPASRDPPDRRAEVGAIEGKPDAMPQLHDLIFGEAGVGARGAGLGTGIAFLDAFSQSVVPVPRCLGM